MRLAVLIPTLESRAHYLSRLMAALAPQLVPGVADVVLLTDDGEQTTGEKRQALLEMTDAAYVAMFDDDDLPAPDYVQRILTALDEEPDIVGFRSRHYVDGGLKAIANHSLTQREFLIEHRDLRGVRRQWKKPNHLNPVRREFALAVGYRAMNLGEDRDYTRRLHETFPSMREAWVDAYLYDYFYRSDRDGERNNLNRQQQTVTA